MSLFNTLFFAALLVSMFGGFIISVIRIVRSVDASKFKRSQAVAWFLRDIIAGLGAGFGAWVVSQAMNNDAGVLTLAFIAALAGVPAIETLIRSQGYKAERDLVVTANVAETIELEVLTARLRKIEEERDNLQKQLIDILVSWAEFKLSVANRQEFEPIAYQGGNNNEQQQPNPEK